jgi:hypothetical protein
MFALDKQRNDARSNENRQHDGVRQQPAGGHSSSFDDGLIEMAGVTKRFVLLSHQEAGESGIGRRQVAGPNASACSVGGLRKAFEVASSGAGRRKNAWSGSGPCGVFARVRVQREGILRINAKDSWPANPMLAQQVPDHNPARIDRQAWRPEQHPTEESNEQKWPGVAGKSREVADDDIRYERCTADQSNNYREYLAEARAQRYGIHLTMLSDSSLRMGVDA